MGITGAKEQLRTRRRQISPQHFPLEGGAIASIGMGTAQMTSQYFHRFTQQYRPLRAEQNFLAGEITRTMPTERTPLADRGIDLAWRFEKSLLELGGKGTGNWTNEQVQQILANGRPDNVTGTIQGRWEGHHINNVSSHPAMQADPDNIKFLTHQEHFQDAHGGDWRNNTRGPLYDRSRDMRRLAIRSELYGLGSVMVLGFSIGISLSLLNRSMIPKERLTQGVDGALMSGTSYTAGRLTAQILSTTSIAQSVQLAGIGVAASVATALYTYMRLRQGNLGKQEAIMATGLQLSVSLTGVFLSTLANHLWGQTAGIWAGLGFAMLALGYSLWKTHHQKAVIAELRLYEIGLMEPNI